MSTWIAIIYELQVTRIYGCLQGCSWISFTWYFIPWFILFIPLFRLILSFVLPRPSTTPIFRCLLWIDLLYSLCIILTLWICFVLSILCTYAFINNEFCILLFYFRPTWVISSYCFFFYKILVIEVTSKGVLLKTTHIKSKHLKLYKG